MKGLLFIIPAFICLQGTAHAAGFWDAAPGARQNAMGTAFTAVADDPYAIFYNPAGLGQQNGTAISGGGGRRFTNQGAAGEASFSYITPYTERESGMWGIGYYGFYDKNSGDRSTALLSFGDKYYSVADRQLPIPVYMGFGVRGSSAKFEGRSEGLLGADFGLMAEFDHGIRAGAAVQDLRLAGGTEPPSPFFNTGAAWRFRNFLISADYRQRNGLGEFYPGAEMAVGDGRLKLRAGKAAPYNSVAQLALGTGFDAGLAVIDTAFSLPWSGLGTDNGFFMLTATIRLGENTDTAPKTAPAAPGPAPTGNQETRRLLERQKKLEADLSEYQRNEKNFKDRVKLLENKIDSMQTAIKEKDRALDNINRKNADTERDDMKDAMAGQAAVPQPQDTSWPKKHIVSDNDTLRSIAVKYYGSAALWTVIESANADKISKGLPTAGAELTIPAPPDRQQ